MDTSYLAQQVTTIIGQLHGLFDDIGVPSHERDSREAALFSALSETLHNQLRQVTRCVLVPTCPATLLLTVPSARSTRSPRRRIAS